jgi:poly(3-hydroxybutyrate) depolymerase
MYEPTQFQFSPLAFLWPAFAAASASEAAALIARQFTELATGSADEQAAEPGWTTPNKIALDLNSVRLRDFSTAETGTPTLLCAPFALHGASITDIAPGHSLVAHLGGAGLTRLYVTDWRPADGAMRYLGIDDYLATLNVLVDQIGGAVDLVGLCQGGWLALLYAARFPAKVRKLVIAGAPIDTAAAPSGLSEIIASTPMALFEELVKLGDGRVIGRKVQKFWGPETVEGEDIHRTLETETPIESEAFVRLRKRFEDWYAWTVDLPGRYYLEGIEKLYKRNELAGGEFIALGERIDLARLRTPLYLLGARDDELVAPAQLLALAHLAGTAPDQIRTDLAPCRHLGLFMGRNVLHVHWSAVARWLAGSDAN